MLLFEYQINVKFRQFYNELGVLVLCVKFPVSQIFNIHTLIEAWTAPDNRRDSLHHFPLSSNTKYQALPVKATLHKISFEKKETEQKKKKTEKETKQSWICATNHIKQLTTF